MSDSVEENKITYEELAPSLQALLKNTVSTDDYSALVEKLETITNSLSELIDGYVKKTEVYEAFHKVANNYNPGTTDNDWNKEGTYIATYDSLTISNQPAASGQLINIPYDKSAGYSTQLFISQPDGEMYIRSSNGSIDSTSFKKVMTSDDVSGVPAIGRIILYAYDVNPSIEYPGTTWVRIGDCYLYSASSLGTTVDDIKASTSDITKKNGSTKITLTEANLPPHSHNGSTTTHVDNHKHGYEGESYPNHSTAEWGWYDTKNNHKGRSSTDNDNSYINTSPAGAHDHTISSTASPNCKSTAIANYPYGVKVAAWYRTA